MKNVDDLIEEAAQLAEQGLSKGEIADELNVSRETASWLVERSASGTPKGGDAGDLHDIHVDWSAIGRDSDRLWHAGAAMADLLVEASGEVDLTVGIEKAGVPLATAVARSLGTDLGTYSPSKHQWEEGDIADLQGAFSRNFAGIEDRECFVVDDTITSGTTMRETVSAIQEAGGDPVACVVLVDKRGVDEIRGVPVHALVEVLRVGNDR